MQVTIAEPHKAVLVPRFAVFYAGRGPQLRVVKEKNQVDIRSVEAGLLHDNLTEVKAGLSVDDWIVADSSSLQQSMQ